MRFNHNVIGELRRNNNKMTQNQLCNILANRGTKMTVRTLSRKESGAFPFDVNELGIICSIFGKNPNFFYADEVSKSDTISDQNVNLRHLEK
jgi:arginine repressor